MDLIYSPLCSRTMLVDIEPEPGKGGKREKNPETMHCLCVLVNTMMSALISVTQFNRLVSLQRG